MAFISLSTTRGQVEHLVNTATIRTVAVGRDEATDERSLLITFLDGTTSSYRPVTARGGPHDYVASTSSKDLLKALRAYVTDQQHRAVAESPQ